MRCIEWRQGNGTSVRLSVPASDRCSSVRRVCCCGPGRQEISIDAARPAPSSNGAAAARRSAAKASSAATFTAAVEG